MYLHSFIDIKNGSIKVPKLNKRIKLIIDKEFSGIPKSVTFSKTKTGKYYVSILVQEEIQMLPPVGGEIGIDLGIKDLLVLSNGVRIGNPKWLRDNQSELAA
jgi:putative transposase